MPFQKGQSGNPNGSAGPRRFHAAVEKALASDDGKRLRAAVDSMLDQAAAGEQWAIEFLADRLDGKATQTVHVMRHAIELSDADLSNIAASRGDGTPEAQDSAEITSSVH